MMTIDALIDALLNNTNFVEYCHEQVFDEFYERERRYGVFEFNPSINEEDVFISFNYDFTITAYSESEYDEYGFCSYRGGIDGIDMSIDNVILSFDDADGFTIEIELESEQIKKIERGLSF